ncbi:MAG: conserved phage C-terminal domain-containing protein [Clostridium sp.]|nr:conserved phage C-terminal domain-containing protein [Clostridium sp.]
MKSNNDSKDNNGNNHNNDNGYTGGQAIGLYRDINSTIVQSAKCNKDINEFSNEQAIKCIDNDRISKVGEATSLSDDINISKVGQAIEYYDIASESKDGQASYSYKQERINKTVNNNEEDIQNNAQGKDYLKDCEEANYKKEEGLSQNNHRGYAEKCSTKTPLLNNSSTTLNNIYNNIKDKVSNIINYLNSKVGVRYKSNNTKTINLVKARLKEGFTLDDFKIVIDKKVKSWKGTKFEQYLTPFTLFGDKFEVYLNQNIVKQEENNSFVNKTSYGRNNKLRFDNFKGRDYDFDKLEKQLLGW